MILSEDQIAEFDSALDESVARLTDGCVRQTMRRMIAAHRRGREPGQL